MKYILVAEFKAALGEELAQSEKNARDVARQMRIWADFIDSQITNGEITELHNFCLNSVASSYKFESGSTFREEIVEWEEIAKWRETDSKTTATKAD